MARTTERLATPLSFTGIQVMSPEVFKRYQAQPPFSLVDTYLELAATGETVKAFRADNARWLDLGSQQNLDQAVELFGMKFFEALKS